MSRSRKFRLFISSTFNDFRKERAVLQTKIFPKIKDYASKHGYTFQPIDLRWGISEEAQLDQKTLELCLSEVRTCKNHMHPNFLIMMGDRYGWIPLPYAIEVDEFDELLNHINSDQAKELKVWYKKDLNQVPASYILKQRVAKYKKYDEWIEVENRLRDILQLAIKDSTLQESQKRKYTICAVEAEVEEGIFPYLNHTKHQKQLLKNNSVLKTIDAQHVFGFFRDIDKETQIEDTFIIDDYDEAMAFKKRVKKILDPENILHIKTQQIDKKTLDTHYLKEFEERMKTFLKQQIDAQKEKDTTHKLSLLEVEKDSQRAFAISKRKKFLAQEKIKKTIADYLLDDDNNQALIIYGESGKGKSALISKAIESAENLKTKKVIYRFVGATPNSATSIEILTSIFDELDGEGKNKSLSKDLEQESFEDFSRRICIKIQNIKEDVAIFIDAVDQLQNDEHFLWMPEELPSNVKIIISALDDSKYKEDSKKLEALKRKIREDNLHIIQEFDKPLELLRALLKQEDRQVDADQEKYFLAQYKKVKSPLYIVIAAVEMKNWKSGDKTKLLADTQEGIIQEFIDNLVKIYHHEPLFVQKALGYIYASRDGLSESELLQLISVDKEFIKKMAPETWHENPNNEFPLIHWSRLQMQLKPFLSSKTQDSQELMYFFHREFEDVVKQEDKQRKEHEAIIKATQELILQNQDKEFDENRWGKLYIELLVLHKEIYRNIFDLEFYSEKLFISISNTNWIVSFLERSLEIGILLYDNNLKSKSEKYILLSYHVISPFYKFDKLTWGYLYLRIINTFSNIYRENNFKTLKINHEKRKKSFRFALEAIELAKYLYNFDITHLVISIKQV